jgi:hypothetical protein
VRAMNLPAMPVTAKSRDECIKIYLKRLSASRACSAHTSMLLTSYLAGRTMKNGETALLQAFWRDLSVEVLATLISIHRSSQRSAAQLQ